MGDFLGDYDYETPGIKLYEQKLFIDYVSKIKNGEDEFCEARNKLCNLAHKYVDGNSSERIFRFIDERMN